MKQLDVIQSMILFDEAGGESVSALYYRGDCSVENHVMCLAAGEVVSFDTYFNLFSFTQLRKYTTVKKITFALTLSGRGTIDLIRAEVGNHGDLIASQSYSMEMPERVIVMEDADLETLPDYCYFRIRSESETRVYNGGLYSDEVPNLVPKVACCFCTYKREKEITRNIESIVEGIIENEESILYQRADVFIADNGHTLSRNLFTSNYIHLYQNKNYGGSAGFTRCMIEARFGEAKSNFTHIILMDDDALIKPYVVERTAELLRYLKPEYQDAVVGGAMLSLQEPVVQIENGSIWNGLANELIGSDLDLRDRRTILRNQEKPADYNAWFFACIPAGFISENNLPLPLFIHGDDINYGLRGTGEVIRMNGICIWHPNPTVRTRPYMEYYNARNYKIADAEYSATLSPATAFYAEMKSILSCALSYRYEEANYRIWGCRDFFKGVDWIKTLDAEKNNMIVLRWKNYPKAEYEHLKDLVFCKPLDNRMGRKRIILNWLCPTHTNVRYYSDSVAWNRLDLFRVRECAILDEETGKGVVLRKDYKELCRTIKELFKLSIEFGKKYRVISREWADRVVELESISFWSEYLDLSKNDYEE